MSQYNLYPKALFPQAEYPEVFYSTAYDVFEDSSGNLFDANGDPLPGNPHLPLLPEEMENALFW